MRSLKISSTTYKQARESSTSREDIRWLNSTKTFGISQERAFTVVNFRRHLRQTMHSRHAQGFKTPQVTQVTHVRSGSKREIQSLHTHIHTYQAPSFRRKKANSILPLGAASLLKAATLYHSKHHFLRFPMAKKTAPPFFTWDGVAFLPKHNTPTKACRPHLTPHPSPLNRPYSTRAGQQDGTQHTAHSRTAGQHTAYRQYASER